VKEIVLYAGDVDERSRFPGEALKALNDSGLLGSSTPGPVAGWAGGWTQSMSGSRQESP